MSDAAGLSTAYEGEIIESRVEDLLSKEPAQGSAKIILAIKVDKDILAILDVGGTKVEVCRSSAWWDFGCDGLAH